MGTPGTLPPVTLGGNVFRPQPPGKTGVVTRLPQIFPQPPAGPGPKKAGDVESIRTRRRAAAGGMQAYRQQSAIASEQLLKPKNRGPASLIIHDSLKDWPTYAETGADQDHMARWVLAFLLTTTFDLERSRTRELIDLITPTATAGQKPTDLSVGIDVADQMAKKKEEVYAKQVTTTVLQATGLAALVQLVPFLDTALKIADLVENVSKVWKAMIDTTDIEALIKSGHEVGILGLLAAQMLDYAAEMKAEAVTNVIVGALNITVNIALPNILSSAINAAKKATESSAELMALTEFVFALRLTQHDLATLDTAARQGDLIPTLTQAAARQVQPDDMSADASLSRLAAKLLAGQPQLTPMTLLRQVVKTNPILAPLMLPDYGGMKKFLQKSVVLKGDDAPSDGIFERVIKAIDARRDARAIAVLQEFVASTDGNALTQYVQLHRAQNAIDHIDQRHEAALQRLTTGAFGALLLGLKPSGFLMETSSLLQQAETFDASIFSLPPPMTVPRRLGTAKAAILAMTRQAEQWREDRALTVTHADLEALVGMRNALSATSSPTPRPPSSLPPIGPGPGRVTTRAT